MSLFLKLEKVYEHGESYHGPSHNSIMINTAAIVSIHETHNEALGNCICCKLINGNKYYCKTIIHCDLHHNPIMHYLKK